MINNILENINMYMKIYLQIIKEIVVQKINLQFSSLRKEHLLLVVVVSDFTTGFTTETTTI